MKELADDNFKVDENIRKFSKWEENTVGKGEIALYEQFLLFRIVFKRLVMQTRKNQGLFGKELKHSGKRRRCWPHFLLFLQCFLPTNLNN